MFCRRPGFQCYPPSYRLNLKITNIVDLALGASFDEYIAVKLRNLFPGHSRPDAQAVHVLADDVPNNTFLQQDAKSLHKKKI